MRNQGHNLVSSMDKVKNVRKMGSLSPFISLDGHTFIYILKFTEKVIKQLAEGTYRRHVSVILTTQRCTKSLLCRT